MPGWISRHSAIEADGEIRSRHSCSLLHRSTWAYFVEKVENLKVAISRQNSAGNESVN